MNSAFRIERRLLRGIHDDLSRRHAHAHERVGFIACCTTNVVNGIVLLAQEYLPVADEDYVINPHVGATMSAAAIRKALEYAYNHKVTCLDAHLDGLMKDFESAVRDLRHDSSDGRIKTCIQKQVNLLEAIGSAAPGVTGNTLGAIGNQVGTWPHHQLKNAMKELYGFACDYPGIRHGGTSANALRAPARREQ